MQHRSAKEDRIPETQSDLECENECQSENDSEDDSEIDSEIDKDEVQVSSIVGVIDEEDVNKLPHLDHHSGDYGENDVMWLSFIDDMKSKKVYSTRVSHFLDYHEWSENPNCMGNLFKSVQPYFQFLHSYYCPSSLFSYFAILKSFFLVTDRGELDKLVPIVPKRIGQWARYHKTKKSNVFSIEEIGIYLKLDK